MRIALDLLEDLPAVHGGHHHVEDDQIGEFPANDVEAGGAIGGQEHVVALELEVQTHELQNVRLIVHD